MDQKSRNFFNVLNKRVHTHWEKRSSRGIFASSFISFRRDGWVSPDLRPENWTIFG
jgi:hypothetical protein